MSKFKSLIVGLLLMVAFVIAPSIATTAGQSQEVIQLQGDNVLIFDQEININTTDVFIAALVGKRMLLDESKTLYVLLVSPGGDFAQAKIMKYMLASVPNVAIICKACNSAAGYLLATGVKRIVIKKSTMAMHEVFMTHFTAKMLDKPNVGVSLKKQSDEFNKAMYSVIGISKEAYEEKITEKVWTLTGEDILKHHLADKFVTLQCNDYMKALAPDTCSQ